MDLGLDEHTAIVTGSSRWLGWNNTETLVSEGTQVPATALSGVELKTLTDQSSDRTVIPLVCDLTDRDKVESLSVRALESFRRLDATVSDTVIVLTAHFEEEDSKHLR